MALPIKLFEGAAHASLYHKFRPSLPHQVFERILCHLQEKKSQPFKLAIDVGCGSGQMTRPLASHFEKVIGVDVSESQLEAARQITNSPNVEYRIGVAEKLPAEDGTVDLVTSSQAVHWFDYGAFLKEVHRVLRPHGSLAIIAHGNRVPHTCKEHDRSKDEKLEKLHTDFYEGSALAPYWSERRKHIDNLYSDFTIPYDGSIRDDTTIEMIEEMTVASFIGYLRSWSAYQSFSEQNPEATDPLVQFYERLTEILGVDKKEDQTMITLKAPMVLLLGRKPSE
ncbi:putative methyltransferase DDB_G0268948 [Asterias amurensis]|uniref:putative methyltransferase DDB_G0268948 n=1 Tax=Asterias amurensis TaxID=7602 RepID=UPI003AB1BD72